MKQWIFREKVPDDDGRRSWVRCWKWPRAFLSSGRENAPRRKNFLTRYGDNGDDPLLILNMEKAAARIVEAIKNNERSSSSAITMLTAFVPASSSTIFSKK